MDFLNSYVILLFLMTKYDFLLVIVIFLDNFAEGIQDNGSKMPIAKSCNIIHHPLL